MRLAELDVALKGGSALPDELELERALVEVSRRALSQYSALARPVGCDELRACACGGGGVPVQRTARDGAVEPPDEIAMRGLDGVLVALGGHVAQLARSVRTVER